MRKFGNVFIGMVITDENYMIKYHDENFMKNVINSKIGVRDDYLNSFFPKILNIRESDVLSIKSKNDKRFLVSKSFFRLEQEGYYILNFLDLSVNDELFQQIDMLSDNLYINNEMLNRMKDGIFITDEAGKTLYVNDAFQKLSGLKREALLGKTVDKLIETSVLKNPCTSKVIESKCSSSTVTEYPNGINCLVSGEPIFDKSNNLKRIICVVQNVKGLETLLRRVMNEKTLSITFDSEIKLPVAIEEPFVTTTSENRLMNEIFHRAMKLAHTNATILITGETGVGKDYFTALIHNQSSNENTGDLIKINCGAIPKHLLESELFGYEEGAFTGAHRNGRIGFFEKANGGTLFLDEIGDLPFILQVKLLTALNDKQFYRVGGSKPVAFNARVIAATNADLFQLVKEKKFRSDLYYRLDVISFEIPPLRKRKEDIIALSKKFIFEYNSTYGMKKYFSPIVLEVFLKYSWPGNIREMKNIIERLTLTSDGTCINIADLKKECPALISSIDHEEVNDDQSLKAQKGAIEMSIIQRALLDTGSVKGAAKLLDIGISTLTRKKIKYSL